MTNINEFKNSKVIVTGGAGFIGSHLVDRLIDLGADVHVIDSLVAGKKEYVNKKAKLHIKDIRDFEGIKKIFKDTKYVFHLAALPRVQYSIEFPLETFHVNVLGTLNVLELSRINKVKKVIFSASGAVYGDQDIMPLHEEMEARPKSPYGLHKYNGELLCKIYSDIYSLDTVSLRYFNVYGPRLNPEGSYALVIGKFLKQRLNNEPLTITGDGKQTRDFTHVYDVVDANILSTVSVKVGEGCALNIGCGKNVSINSLAKMIGGDIVYIDSRLEPRHALADNKRAKKLLNWSPKVMLKEGILELKKIWNIKD